MPVLIKNIASQAVATIVLKAICQQPVEFSQVIPEIISSYFNLIKLQALVTLAFV